MAAALTALRAAPERDGDHLVVQVPAGRVPEVLEVVAGHRATDVTCQAASLEDLFLRHYEDVL